MAFTPMQPFNYGGGEIGTGIARGIQAAGQGFGGFLKEKKEEKKRTQFGVAKAIEDIPDEDLILEKHKEYAGGAIDDLEEKVTNWMQYDDDGTTKKNVFNRGTLTVKQQARLASLIKKTTQEINNRKQTHQDYLKAKDVLVKDKDKYWDENYFKQAEQQYFETGQMPETGFLKEAMVDLQKDVDKARTLKTTGIKEDYKNGVDYRTGYYNSDYGDIKMDRQKYFDTQYKKRQGYREMVIDEFDKIPDNEKEGYYQAAMDELQRQNKPTDDQQVVFDETMKAFGRMEIAPKYWQEYDAGSKKLSPRELQLRQAKPEKEEKIKDISQIEPKVKEFNGVPFKKFKDLTTDKIIRKKSPLIGAIEIAEEATRKIDDRREYTFDILGIDEDRDVMIVRTIPTGKYEDIIDEKTGEKRKVFRGQPDRIIIAPINQNRYLLQDLFDIGSLNKQTGFEFDNY